MSRGEYQEFPMHERHPMTGTSTHLSPDLDSAALLGEESASSSRNWAAVPNLDQFFRRVYAYYSAKGFMNIIISRILSFLALAFTIAFSSFLLFWVDWGALIECGETDTEPCADKAIRSDAWSHWPLFHVLYLVIFWTYWLWQVAHFVWELRGIIEMRSFYNNQLEIPEYELQSIPWREVVFKLISLQERQRISIVNDSLNAHDIANRIMRKENYLIGMFNKDVIQLNFPVPNCLDFGERKVLTRSLEWNLSFCITDSMFDEHFRIRDDFLSDPGLLRRRFIAMGFVNLVLAPFILVFMFVYFFFKNAEEFHNRPGSIGNRQWSPLARWKFREFNELPHVFNRRMNASNKDAGLYVDQFPSTLMSHLAKFVTFILGAFVGVMIVVGFLDDSLLTQTQFHHRNLIWHMAVFATIIAVARTFIIDHTHVADPEKVLRNVATHTHHLPRHWRSRAHTYTVREEFCALYQYKAVLFLQEVLSILLTPFLLWFTLPGCSEQIVEFVRDFTHQEEGLGHVCAMAMFDFQRFGNKKYGASGENTKYVRSKQGKMEKSFLNFQLQHPDWIPNTQEGRELIGRLQDMGEGSVLLHPQAGVMMHGASGGDEGHHHGDDSSHHHGLMSTSKHSSFMSDGVRDVGQSMISTSHHSQASLRQTGVSGVANASNIALSTQLLAMPLSQVEEGYFTLLDKLYTEKDSGDDDRRAREVELSQPLRAHGSSAGAAAAPGSSATTAGQGGTRQGPRLSGDMIDLPPDIPAPYTDLGE
eukprot:TRINITY_DN1010_c0_g2_i1.p1 TRINITY_DN1010_c0_g2~~TRINITY_DN1010_c0_g2_i1.p1  ORF type:complete len:759 (+),score=183.40 TRINITY_DN1010_c0_g2_i1:637-2913(+)